ncbi:hypothetical protein Btru_063850 [Bulinus truncatus]|nr:hypothetical protein Btru_063850 [Bulinus truncatus]
MTNVLKLDINLVIFADTKARTFLEKMRRGREKHTRIFNSTLVDLPYYRQDGHGTLVDFPYYRQVGHCTLVEFPYYRQVGHCTLVDLPYYRQDGHCTLIDFPYYRQVGHCTLVDLPYYRQRCTQASPIPLGCAMLTELETRFLLYIYGIIFGYIKYRDRMAEIMNSSEYKKDNQLVEQKLCESYIPEYDILQLSKLYFINRTVWENPFSTSYFMWMDGGYAHGHDVFPKNFLWFLQNLFEFSDKVTFMERPPGVKAFEDKIDKFHKLSINILAGNFFAGGAGLLKELCEMQRHLVDEWVKKGVVDDDQTMYMLMYYKKPSLFRLACICGLV